MQAASQGVDTLMGLAMEGHNDRRQLRQQGRLLEQQAGVDRKQAAFNQALGMQTWKETGPVAMTEQLKKAGLSPALQYGGAGGGGQTMGNPGGSVNAESAPRGGNEVMGLTMMNAQRELIEAQTRNVEADTAKKAGVDTELARQQGRLQHIIADLHAMTNEDAAEQMQARTHILWQEAKAAKGKVTAELQQKQAEAIGAELANELRKVQTDMTEVQMKAIAEEIAQKWKGLDIQQGHLDLQRFVQDVSNTTKLTVETITKAAQMVGGGVIKGIPGRSIHTKEIKW